MFWAMQCLAVSLGNGVVRLIYHPLSISDYGAVVRSRLFAALKFIECFVEECDRGVTIFSHISLNSILLRSRNGFFSTKERPPPLFRHCISVQFINFLAPLCERDCRLFARYGLGWDTSAFITPPDL